MLWVTLFTGILFAYTYFPPYWLQSYTVAVRESVIAPTTIETSKDTKIAETPQTTSLQPIRASSNELKNYLREVSSLYGQDYQKMEAVVNCESSFQVDPPHNGISFGVAQFTIATWHDFGSGDIMNPFAQLQVMAKMWKSGLSDRWDCFNILYGY